MGAEITSKKHFEDIAQDYDRYKKKNWYYYRIVKQICRDLIEQPEDKSILEIGCGTGDIIHSLNPKRGLGIDISPKMVDIAKEKYGSTGTLEFVVGDAETFKVSEEFDVVLLVDVVEHIPNVEGAIQNIRKLRGVKKVVVLYGNPLWNPLMHLGERLGLKMPEGPHRRIKFREFKGILERNHFRVVDAGGRTIMLVHIPIFSDVLNRVFNMIPILNSIGIQYYFVCEPIG